ncbi:MAG: hypothetical protein M1840_006740 [Geoglossum simile]|nr:MAG: hypothetical protein M1840_006740 [Geoglossum simile]
MWNRKSVTAVKETQVADPPAPARSVRQYKVTSASAWTRQFKIKEQPSRNVIYMLTFTAPFQDWGMVLTTSGSKNAIAAAAKISLWRTITQLALGDPSSEPDTAQRVELKLDSKWKHNKYAVSLPLPPTGNGDSNSEGPVLEMQWKGTNEVKGFMNKLDRGMHHKLVEKNSNRLLARYVHNPWSMDVAGTVEIYADIPGIMPQQWDLFVLVSALAIAEKTLKMVNLAMHNMDGDPSGMVEPIMNSVVTGVAGQAQSTVDGAQQ